MSMNELEILKAACCIAALDDTIDATERRVLKTLADRAGVGQASLDAMMEMAVEDEDYFQHQLDLLTADADRSIKLLFRIAIVDGALGTNERVVLQHFADKLGVETARFEKILDAAEREVQKA